MKQSGNALFLILIAVALFAALSYAVTQSGRGGGSIDREAAALAASQAVQYGASLEQAITRMRVTSGCTAELINFDNSQVAGYNNTSSPTDESCDVFSPNGGGITFQSPPNSINDGSDWFFTGEARVIGVGIDTLTGAAGIDLIAILRNVTPEACREINNRVGIGATIPLDSGDLNENQFTGTFVVTDTISDAANSGSCPATFCRHFNACFQEAGGGGRLIYYHVLFPR